MGKFQFLLTVSACSPLTLVDSLGIHDVEIPHPKPKSCNFGVPSSHHDGDAINALAAIDNWNSNMIYGKTQKSENLSSVDEQNPLTCFDKYWQNLSDADPDKVDIRSSPVRLFERKLGYVASGFHMPTECLNANNQGIDMRLNKILEGAEWGKATAGAGRVAGTLGAMYNGRSLKLGEIKNSVDEKIDLLQDLFPNRTWERFEQQIFEDVLKRDDVRYMVFGSIAHDMEPHPQDLLLLTEHRLWQYQTNGPVEAIGQSEAKGTWHRDICPFDEHFEKDTEWFRGVEQKLNIEQEFFPKAFETNASMGNLFAKGKNRKALMFTIVNTLRISNLNESISGSRLRDRDVNRAYQLPAVEGTGVMFRTGGDPVSGSGRKSKNVDIDVPFHAGPPLLNPVNPEKTAYRIFTQTKVLVLKASEVRKEYLKTV
jgi:hypothetical protein